MSVQCLRCGKQLGSNVVLCYACWCELDDPRSFDGFDSEIYQRVREYFVIAALRCSKCGSLHTTVSVDDKMVSAADFDIDSVEEWEQRLNRHEEWIKANPEAVRSVLPALADEWPRSIEVLRQTVLETGIE